MGLRNFNSVPYIPLLGLRPAELQALKELPVADKQAMMPLLQIGPWATANYLHSAISKLEEAYADFPCFVSIADFDLSTTERPVHLQLAELQNPTNGYEAWCRFIESKNQFVPTLQLASPNEISAQAVRLHGLGRGLMVLIERGGFPGIDFLAQTIVRSTNGGADVCFTLDFGRSTRNILTMTLEFQGMLRRFYDMPRARMWRSRLHRFLKLSPR